MVICGEKWFSKLPAEYQTILLEEFFNAGYNNAQEIIAAQDTMEATLIEKGKPTEVDAINGAVSDFGRKVHCPTPANDCVVEIIHRIERGELKPCFDNLKFFEK